MSHNNTKKSLVVITIIIACLILLHFTTKPPTDTALQDIRELNTGAEKTKQRLQLAVDVTEKGTNYIIGNSDLNERESRAVFFLCLEKSQKYDIPLDLLLNVIRVESNFNQVAVSHKGARGILQVMPKTAQGLCKELNLTYHKNKLFDMEFNMELGCYFLNQLYGRYGNWEEALSHYNSGKCQNLEYLKRIRGK